RPGRRDHAVAVPVGLDRGQHLAAADELAQRGDVGGDRAEVDDGFPIHAGTVPVHHRLRNAAGSARTRSEAPIGACAVPSPGPAAASLPARPCRYAPARPAWAGARPWASSAPVSPDSTSPLPAVASHGVPVGLTRTGPESGDAMTVVEPFSSTVTPSRAAARRACSSRRASTLAGSVP